MTDKTYFNNYDLNLTLLMEECAEIIQICSKIKRFGMDDYHEKTGNITNLDLLHRELGDLYCIVKIMVDNGILDIYEIEELAEEKPTKLKKYYRRIE